MAGENPFKKAAKAFTKSRPEWRGLRDERMISFLASFDNDHEDGDGRSSIGGGSTAGLSTTADRAMLLQMFHSRPDFARMTLLRCVEGRKRGRLGYYLDLVEESLSMGDADRTDGATWSKDAKEIFFTEIFSKLLLDAVESGDRLTMREVLANAHDRRPALVPTPLKAFNSPALLEACLREDREMVRLLVDRGYRLRSMHFDAKKTWKESTWSGLPIKRPRAERARGRDWRKDGEEDEGDEVFNMHVLRAMSKPCYVFTCYTVVSDVARKLLKKKQRNENGDVGRECGCDGEVHRGHCPDNRVRFDPKLGCLEHPACNDPIFWFFKISKVASSHAGKVPEYREEYESIASASNRSAVHLLDQCQDTAEVEILLSEKSGVTDFLHHSAVKRMDYPRLQMAIVNNHKAFVGHMYCQQVLRNKWNGGVPWQGKGILFRLVYIFLQLLMLPWWSLMYYAKITFRDFGLDEKHPEKRPSFIPYSVYEYITGSTNLDKPLNRYISFTIMYFFFLFLVLWCIFSPVIEAEDLTNNYHWYHTTLLFMTAAMFLQIITSMHMSVQIGSSTNLVWKMYDFLMCVLLGCAFLVRTLMGKLHECPDQVCDLETLDARIPFDTLSNCFFSVSGIMAITRLLYWFQLLDRVGPIVINLSRVVTDVITFLAIFVVLVAAYTVALVPLKAINSRCDNYTEYIVFPEEFEEQLASTSRELNEQLEDGGCWFEWEDTLFVDIFMDMLGLIFWGMLNPEYPDAYFSTETAEGFFAIAIYATYCIFTIIILLNLLIAIMNTTIQKVHDRKHLYWKFVRTSIWMEFFGEAYALPPPLSIFLNIRSLIKGIYRRSSRLYGKVRRLSYSTTH